MTLLTTETVRLGDLYRPIKGVLPAGLITSDTLETASGSYSHLGTTPWTAGASKFNLQGQNWQPVTPGTPAAGCVNKNTNRNYAMTHTFDFEIQFTGDKLGFYFLGNGGGTPGFDTQVFVEMGGDMYKIADRPQWLNGSGSRWRNIVFSQMMNCRIRFVGAGIYFLQLEHEQSAVVAPAPDRPMLLVDGDSYVESQPATLNTQRYGGFDSDGQSQYFSYNVVDGLLEETGMKIGRYAQGGTGYFQNGDGVARTSDVMNGSSNASRWFSADRLSCLARGLAEKPIALVINGSINDGNLSGGTVPMRNRCLAAWNAVTAIDPLCSIVQVTPEPYHGLFGFDPYAGSDHDLNRLGHIQAGALHPRCIGVVDASDPAKPWWNGDGYSGNPSSSSQAVFTGRDTLHSNYRGARYYGRRIALEMANFRVPAVRANGAG